MIEEMHETAGLDVTIYFYNPNIHPRAEYIIRKDENKRYADALGIEFIDADYDSDQFLGRAKGMEFDPERGPVVLCVSICGWTRLTSTRPRMAFIHLPQRMQRRGGRIRIKSTEAVSVLERCGASLLDI